MNEHAQKWVAALRSGEYRQGREALRREDSYCCLGVAVDLYLKEVGGEWEFDENQGSYLAFGVGGFLPARVTEWLGLTNSAGAPDLGATLAELNDFGGVSFDQIADVIESEPPGMFKVTPA